MKIPLSLLNKWITVNRTPAQMAEALTGAGLEVDSYNDELLAISLTPNLSHAMSVLGVARELSALFNCPLTPQEITPLKTGTTSAVTVKVDDPQNCPRYMALVIEGVTVRPSPAWLQEALALSGIRSINNVVDITNYVMHMIGQPLHAFDLDKIPSKTLIIRKARGEKLTLLDGRTVSLDHDMLVIADEKEPLALAGVMGGLSSEVDETTKTILLEVAHFSPSVTRRSSKKTMTVTDGSKRFERGHDANLCDIALPYAAALIQSCAGGIVSSEPVDIKAREFLPKTLVVRLERINKLLGLTLSLNEVEEIFKRLFFTISHRSETTLHVQVPTWRVDITAEIDLVEEVARLYGYNNIPRRRPTFRLSSIGDNPIYCFTKEMETRARCLGLQQLLTCDLIGPRDVEANDNLVFVMNASSQEQSILRPSLLPGLLGCLKHNMNHQEPNLQGFEIGRVHYKLKGQFIEEEKMGIILHGAALPPHWSGPTRDVDFYDLKGLVSRILGNDVVFKPSELSAFHPYQQMQAFLHNESVAILGQLRSAPVFFAEINLSLLITLPRPLVPFQPLPVYPATERDLTITLKEETTLEEILKAVDRCRSALLEKVNVVNIYRHENLGRDRKNLSLRFHFRSPHKTLSFEDAEKEFARLSQALESFVC